MQSAPYGHGGLRAHFFSTQRLPMVTQKPISAKINTCLLEKLDLECAVSAQKRNKTIHCALNIYLDFVDVCRRMKILPGIDKEKEMVLFFDRWAPHVH